jgi:hypothetical protein
MNYDPPQKKSGAADWTKAKTRLPTIASENKTAGELKTSNIMILFYV